MAIEPSDELLELERAAWAEQQAGALTVETARAVQSAITAEAEASGVNRFELERAVKAAVRHPEPEA